MATDQAKDKAHGDTQAAPPKRTPLFAAHEAAGARLVPFAGYALPIQYGGIIAEHTATRESAGLFDVSHMGQLLVSGPGAGAWLERLTPSSIGTLGEGRARYSVLTNDAGGVVDDLIITRFGDTFRLVVNGARRAAVAAHFAAHADPAVTVAPLDRALIALQGPRAEAILAPHVAADIAALPFMAGCLTEAFGADAMVSRVGYTGEDGFEISLPPAAAMDAWARLTDDARVTPVGLGARDTLRLEAGLCLYGQDLDETMSPVEAGISFVIGKARRSAGGFLGEKRILRELAEGPARQRVGLTVTGRVPVRAGAEITADDAPAGTVTSGGVGPTVGTPIAMGFVPTRLATPGTPLTATVRGRPIALTVTALPFVPARTKRGKSA
ncbi:MAG: glycine cleavage system aminomethyltransferase GcvT [Pseudomonadota bacterium]